MSSAYIEKLARVIWDGDSRDPEARGYSWGEAIESVRAIITAMLEPSEGMICAGIAEDSASSVVAVYTAMLQAALDET